MLLQFPSISMSLNNPMKQVILNGNQRPVLHLSPVHHLQHRRGQPSRSERRARQAADREVSATQRSPLLQDSDYSDSTDPFADLSAYVDVSYSNS